MSISSMVGSAAGFVAGGDGGPNPIVSAKGDYLNAKQEAQMADLYEQKLEDQLKAAKTGLYQSRVNNAVQNIKGIQF